MKDSTRNGFKWLLVGAFVLMALFVVVGEASAQTETNTRVTITTLTEKIKPLGGFQQIPIEICYTYQPTSTAVLLPTQVALTATAAQSFFQTVVSPSNYQFPIEAADPTAPKQRTDCSPSGSIVVLVSANADAPAFTPTEITVSAVAAQNSGALAGSSNDAKTLVEAEFFSIIDASTPVSIITATPQQQVTYPITVTNLGNAQTKVFFDIDNVPDGWQVTPPPPLTLESKQSGGKQNVKVANVLVLTAYKNGYLNTAASLTVKITSNYAFDATKIGDRTTVATLTVDKGFYVPGFEPLALFGAIGAAGFALQRVRRTQ